MRLRGTAPRWVGRSAAVSRAFRRGESGVSRAAVRRAKASAPPRLDRDPQARRIQESSGRRCRRTLLRAHPRRRSGRRMQSRWTSRIAIPTAKRRRHSCGSPNSSRLRRSRAALSLAGASEIPHALWRLRPSRAGEGMVAHRRRGRRRGGRMSVRKIPAHVIARQIEAADPEKSFWVTANAGAGKTHVLAQRVIRLLLEGAEPGKILCITYTKAAAANMANRVFERCRAGRGSTMPNSTRRSLHRQHTADAGAACRRAAAVRARAGDAGRPEGADHPRLLHAAAASVSVRGQCLGALHRHRGCGAGAVAASGDDGVLLDAAAAPDTPLGRALAYAITAAADPTFREVVTDAIKLRARLKAWTGHAGSVDGAITAAVATTGRAAGDTRNSLDLRCSTRP